MSLVLSGPRRTYVLLLFRERVGNAGATPGPLGRLESALGIDVSGERRTEVANTARARLVVSTRMRRRWGRSVVGLSLFVLAAE